MKNNKNIDRLFQERFKDFEAAPPPQVWDNIAAELQPQKRRKFVPLWFKLAGAAAVLLLFFSLGNYWWDNHSQTDAPILVDAPTDKEKENRPEAIEPTTFTKKTEERTETPTEALSNTETAAQHDAVVAAPSLFGKDEQDRPSATIQTTETTQKPVNDKKADSPQKPTKDIAYQVDEKAGQSQTPVKELDKPATDSGIVQPDKTFDTENQIATEQTPSMDATIEDGDQPEKKSLIEYLEEREAAAADKAISDSDRNRRWEITPNAAPVYYNGLGNKGSSVDPSLANSPKSGDTNYSYGVNIGYAVNEKFSIRTGVNRVDVGYTTNNIEFAVAPASAGLRTVDYNHSGQYVVAVGPAGSLGHLNSNPYPNEVGGQQLTPRAGSNYGSLQQNIGYVEIPVELKYNLLNTRFGAHMLGGLSTLLLEDNSISVISNANGFENVIGEANNLNAVSFSANFGLGLDYKLSNRFVLNLEPVFKYHLNPYSGGDVDFRPYMFGVYSGVRFRL